MGPDAQTQEVQHDAAAYRAWVGRRLPALRAGESMATYAARVGEALDLRHCRVVHSMEQDGLYLYKRPVVGAGGAANILSQAGSIFHHILLLVKDSQGVTALEMGPRGDADVTSNIFEAVEAGPVLYHSSEQPADGRPLLHIAAPHHQLSQPAVQQAIHFAQAQQYHTVHSNCIQFADFAVRLLTGGAVFGAPLAYDVLCGSVPPADSPLLGMLAMLQMTWLDVCDGSRLMTQFLAQHEPPPPLAPVPSSAALEAASSAKASSGTASASKSLLQPGNQAGADPGSMPKAGGLPDFLAAALSAAHSGGDGSVQGDRGRVQPQGGLPDLLGTVLAAAREEQQGAGQGSGGVSGGGIAGLLSAALAGGLEEVAHGSQGGSRGGSSTGVAVPKLPARPVKHRPA